jgi:hypothetical protein
MKIYNEIVIDMNPESPTFEETLSEDSFEYSGGMMLAQYGANQFNEGDYIFVARPEEGEGFYRRWKVENGRWVDDHYNIHENLMESAGQSDYLKVDELPGNEFIVGYNPESLESRGVGMGDVTAEDMLGKNEDEMLQWIIDTRYGGKLPTNITENDILTQIRTKLPQKGGITGTDWYGLQDTAAKVGQSSLSVFGGMSAGKRGQRAGQRKIGKDIYALEEEKGDEWTSKFRTFLSSLPTATGTG